MEITFSFACGSAVPGEIGTVGKKWDKMNNLIKKKNKERIKVKKKNQKLRTSKVWI